VMRDEAKRGVETCRPWGRVSEDEAWPVIAS
jgi:hypothetical protein